MKPNITLRTAAFAILGLSLSSCGGDIEKKIEDKFNERVEAERRHTPSNIEVEPIDSLRVFEERHFASLKQLTFAGENAEAYFSPDGTQLVFQATRGEFECDQIFTVPVIGGEPTLVSTGKGRTTCSYFMPDSSSIVYASTHHHDQNCPPKPDYSQGYVWPVYDTFDLFVRTAGDSLYQLTDTHGYDAEATLSPLGDKIVFTSMRSGDLDIWSMNIDGSGLKRLTTSVGYDGGPFFSPDGTEIVYRASSPATSEELKDYKTLLGQQLIRPGQLNIYVMNANGSNKRLVLENGAANFAPYFFPDGERIIFSSNMDDPRGRNFDLYMVNKDGSGLERVTYNETFDGFPMFSPDGRYLAFASNRNNAQPNDTNVFIAEWVD